MIRNTIETIVRLGACTGCGACEAVCPARCISFTRDAEGFDVPSLTIERCVGCGMCLSYCHSADNSVGTSPLSAKAALSENVSQRAKSSSGGLSAAIVETVIERGGCAYGAIFNETGAVRHVRAGSIESAAALQGSKYVQSKTAGILVDVKADVQSGQEVVFVGTPCQVAGLRYYLGRNYSNLLCVDLVCHGVPSPGFWERHIDSICRGRLSDSRKISFRAKTYYEKNDFALRFPRGNRVVRSESEVDVYYRAFLQGLSFRECCYKCQYARIERVGDITLGDCASSCLIPDFFPEESLSLLLINSEQGAHFIRILEDGDKIKTCNIDITQEVKRNHQLSAPSPRPSGRSDYYTRLFESASENAAGTELRVILKLTIKHLIKLLTPYRLRMRVRSFLGGSR